MSIIPVFAAGAAIDKLNSPMALAVKEIKAQYGDDVVIGRKSLHKFGENDDIDTADGILDITQIAGLAKSNEAYQTTNSIDTISSSNAGDTHDLTIEGMTISGNALTFVTQTVTLNGQNKVVLSTPLARCTRMANLSNTATQGVVYVYLDDTITAGVPNDLTKVHNVLSAPDESSLRAGTSVSSNNYFLVGQIYTSLSRSASTRADVKFIARTLGSVFSTRRSYGMTQDSSNTIKFDPPFIIPPNSDIMLQGTVTANNSTIFGGFDGIFADIIQPETLSNISVGADEWIDVNTTLSIPVGRAMIIQNLGRSSVHAVINNDTAPAAGTGFNIIEGSDGNGAGVYVGQGSGKLWLKAAQFKETVSVQLA